jgi:hypothetical protein
MIKTNKIFRELLDNMQGALHHMTIYCGLDEFIKHKSCKKKCIWDEQLHAMELGIDHGIELKVEGLEGECTSQMC